MSNRMLKKWFFSAFDTLRQNGELQTTHPSIKPLHERSHLVAFISKSQLAYSVDNARPICITLTENSLIHQLDNESLWKKIQEQLPEGTAIHSLRYGNESIIVKWENDRVRYKSTGNLIAELNRQY